ncbi:bifunctional UDP-4-keto-pentose/UDP-xylose synthase [Fangia hongkongensis]|uniref:bifunctional UDP-4-keto-pentose/UDP-xylose synthase n=1 Tax=Fangia hongkongensis TaxID=270495 RepID=UPI00036E2117|nr:bifunctional UDP-4-keto-pentose/UDP-xylose synthase [Fangia hongkongensis]MBK2126043.1 bifunctional UDP-4-keto-pentose/UDP-xylose synthase [Fangia hongkongensis]
MSTKLLVLGVNGFIGSSMVEKILAETDWEIYGMDLSDHKIQAFLDHPRLHFVKDNVLENTKWVEEHIQKCDVIFPLVAVANPALYVSDPLFVYKLDFESNMDIIKLCVKHKKHLIFPSTSEVYGMSEDVPFNEETSALVTGPINKPRWIYSCSKQLLDRVIHAYGMQEGLSYTLFRPFNWIGPKQDEIKSSKAGSARVLAQFISNILDGKDLQLVDGGLQRRCFTYIDDGIDALIEIIKKRDTSAYQRIFNLGNPDNEHSIKELAEMTIDALKRYPSLKKKAENAKIIVTNSDQYYGEGYQDVQRRVPSIENAKQALSWAPKYSMKEALKKTFDYHLV